MDNNPLVDWNSHLRFQTDPASQDLKAARVQPLSSHTLADMKAAMETQQLYYGSQGSQTGTGGYISSGTYPAFENWPRFTFDTYTGPNSTRRARIADLLRSISNEIAGIVEGPTYPDPWPFIGELTTKVDNLVERLQAANDIEHRLLERIVDMELRMKEVQDKYDDILYRWETDQLLEKKDK